MVHMKQRITVSIEPEALEIARMEVRAGRAPNVSAAVEESLKAGAKRQAIREAVDLWEDEYGPIGEEAKEWARKELKAAWGEPSSSTRER